MKYIILLQSTSDEQIAHLEKIDAEKLRISESSYLLDGMKEKVESSIPSKAILIPVKGTPSFGTILEEDLKKKVSDFLKEIPPEFPMPEML